MRMAPHRCDGVVAFNAVSVADNCGPRSWGRLGLSLVATVAFAALAASAPNAGAGDPAGYDPPDVYENIECDPKANPKVAEGCEEWVDPDAAYQEHFERVIKPKLDAAFGSYEDRLSWWDGTGWQSVLRVGIVGPTPEDYAKLGEITGGDPRIILVPVAHTWRQLEAIKEQVMEQAIRLGGDHQPQVIAARVEPPLQKVVLDAQYFEPAWVAEMYSLFPPEVLEIRVSPYVVWELMHTTRTDYPPYEGGLGLTVGGP